MGDEAGGGGKNMRSRAIVLLQPDDLGAWEVAVEPENVENVKNLYFAEELPASSRAGKNVKSDKKGKKAKAKAAGR